GQGGIDLLGQGMNLAATGSSHYYEEVVKRSDATHIEDENVLSLVIKADAGTQESVIGGDLGTRATRLRGGLFQSNAVQRTSFGKCVSARKVQRQGAKRRFAGFPRYPQAIVVGHLQAETSDLAPFTPLVRSDGSKTSKNA